MNSGQDDGNEAYFQTMKQSRKGPAVLKLRLANLRSEAPTVPIFAFEGSDDKIVYYNWIKRIDSSLQYEPFPCSGKENVLELIEMIERDLSGIGVGVFFFIDRDFDDLRGRDSRQTLFMTEAYSVENYLVSETVLEELLKNEFHWHAQPNKRKEIVAMFLELYGQFLEITYDINFRLFISKKLQIEHTRPLPDKINQLADIELRRVRSPKQSAVDLIPLQREPTDKEAEEYLLQFAELKADTRFRGKFCYLFFLKWLQLLAEAQNLKKADLFGGLPRSDKVQFQLISLGSLASKSALPEGLPKFIKEINGTTVTGAAKTT